MLTLNQIIDYAKAHNIDFDKPLMSLYDAESTELSHIEQVAVSAQGTNLVLIDKRAGYSRNLIETLKLQDTVNLIDTHKNDKTPHWIKFWNYLMDNKLLHLEFSLAMFQQYANCFSDKKWSRKFTEFNQLKPETARNRFNEYINSI